MVKRNDVVVIEEARSMTSIKGSTKRYKVYFLARASKVGRDGIVKEVDGTIVLDDRHFILTIDRPETQAAARALLEKTPPGANQWMDQRLLRDAILREAGK